MFGEAMKFLNGRSVMTLNVIVIIGLIVVVSILGSNAALMSAANNMDPSGVVYAWKTMSTVGILLSLAGLAAVALPAYVLYQKRGIWWQETKGFFSGSSSRQPLATEPAQYGEAVESAEAKGLTPSTF